MFGAELLFALIVAAVLSVVLVGLFGWRHPARADRGAAGFFLFLTVFLVAWGVGAWMTPFGPALWGAYWVPFLIIGLFVALAIAAAVPGRRDRDLPHARPSTEVERVAEAEDAAAGVAIFGLFFWVLAIVALIAIIAAYV